MAYGALAAHERTAGDEGALFRGGCDENRMKYYKRDGLFAVVMV